MRGPHDEGDRPLPSERWEAMGKAHRALDELDLELEKRLALGPVVDDEGLIEMIDRADEHLREVAYRAGLD